MSSKGMKNVLVGFAVIFYLPGIAFCINPPYLLGIPSAQCWGSQGIYGCWIHQVFIYNISGSILNGFMFLIATLDRALKKNLWILVYCFSFAPKFVSNVNKFVRIEGIVMYDKIMPLNPLLIMSVRRIEFTLFCPIHPLISHPQVLPRQLSALITLEAVRDEGLFTVGWKYDLCHRAYHKIENMLKYWRYKSKCLVQIIK